VLNALVTGAVAYVFAYVWTDELVDGSPYAVVDPVGTGFEGASAGLVPIVVGLGLCAVILWATKVVWWWPALCVAAGGASGAVLGAMARFPVGMLTATAAILIPLALVGAVGLMAGAGSRGRRSHGPPVGGAA
jgi:hypothetical protein